MASNDCGIGLTEDGWFCVAEGFLQCVNDIALNLDITTQNVERPMISQLASRLSVFLTVLVFHVEIHCQNAATIRVAGNIGACAENPNLPTV